MESANFFSNSACETACVVAGLVPCAKADAASQLSVTRHRKNLLMPTSLLSGMLARCRRREQGRRTACVAPVPWCFITSRNYLDVPEVPVSLLPPELVPPEV